MEDKGYLVTYVYENSFQCDKNALLFLVWDGERNTFRKVRGRQKTLSASVDS